MKLLCKLIACTTLAVVIKETASLICEEKCRANPGTCVYPSTKSPLPTKKTPQFVTITFDNPVTYEFEKYVEQIFGGRHNPDNSSTTGTLFFPHRDTDYQIAKRLCNKGHEIGLSAASIGGFEHLKYINATQLRQILIIDGAIKVYFNVMLRRLRPYSARMPIFHLAGDDTFIAYSQAEVNRDSTCVVKDKLFPYTLDCPTNQSCSTGSLGTKSHPGQWIMPIVEITRKDGSPCNTLADCGTENYTAPEIFNLLKNHFNSLYFDNRAPLTLPVSTKLFETSPNSLQGLKSFVHYLNTFDDVYLVPLQEVTKWMGNPTPLPYITDFVANACGPCNDPRTCEYTVDSESIEMNICGVCPKDYPGTTIVVDV